MTPEPNSPLHRALTEVARLAEYADWQIREGGNHHPTLPSALAEAEKLLAEFGMETRIKRFALAHPELAPPCQ